MGYRVGIYDRDTEYTRNLMDYVNRHHELGITLFVYTCEEQLWRDAAREGLALAVIPEKKEASGETLPVLYLTADKTLGSGGNFVYKYQSAKQLAQRIRGKITDGGDRPVSASRIYGGYSPLGRSGKTTLARGLCAVGRNSLYVSLEDYHPAAEGENDGAEGDRMLYLIAGGNREFAKLIPHRGMSYDAILENCRFAELRNLGEEELRFMCRTLAEEGRYQRIVLDIGTGAMAGLSVLSVCDRIYVPILQDEVSCGKLDVFKKQIAYGNLRGLLPKIRYMTVPVMRPDDEDFLTWIREGDL